MSAHAEARPALVGPLLSFLALSDLAREGIANRGSFRFADHVYKGEPSGRGALGRGLDATFLRLPAAQAFRRRYVQAREAMAAAATAWPRAGEIRILTVPCGIPRDIVEMAGAMREALPGLLDRVEYVGMDIDPEALRAAAAFATGSPLRRVAFHRGDALDRNDYPAGPFHIASSTGLTEFLDDDQVATLYANVFDVLEKGGTFYTSATALDRCSALLLRLIDLPTMYRTPERFEEILGRLPWSRVRYTLDPTGFQTFATAIK